MPSKQFRKNSLLYMYFNKGHLRGLTDFYIPQALIVDDRWLSQLFRTTDSL